MIQPRVFVGIAAALVLASCGMAEEPAAVTNSVGMRLVTVPAGSFEMGSSKGDWDEAPVHKVTISRSFRMSTTEVTNAQYEQFDPSHKKLRGESGFSKGDDEAVVFVSWHDAVKFCEWLSEKEGKPYRLPTEAEWEYGCRAGTTTPYHTGDDLPKAFHKNQHDEETSKPVSLRVGTGAANPWGLHDMHGNVEEWCSDRYGPYEKRDQIDPVGRLGGDFRVTRGGSHNTNVQFLRSANRSGTLPADRHWLIGFRVVMGAPSKSKALPVPEAPLWARRVAQKPCDWSGGPDSAKPYFEGPITYVKVPPGSNGPMFSKHNHDPGLAYCPNGDLLAIWYTCNREQGRELGILASRLRRGAKQWEPASPFWDAPDRNDHAPAIWYDGKGTLHHFNGFSVGPGLRTNLALVLRTSTDSGATWSPARLINPQRGLASQPVTTVFRARDGRIVLPVDAPWLWEGGATALWMSGDEGKTWSITDTGATGIHAGFVQLADGKLLSFGRYKKFESAHMPQSVSPDMGKTWTRSDSEFPPVSMGQRLVLLRLREGAILLVSFTDPSKNGKRGIVVRDTAGGKRRVYGMYAALSFDEGKTWPVKKLLTAGGPAREMDGLGNTHKFTMDETRAEPRGYLAATQTPDGVIHLISSALHYRFNLAWLKTPMPAARAGEANVVKAVANSLGMTMVRIEAGAFRMGQEKGGDFDERPVHKVTIGRALDMSATEVTNAQYERFDPSHRKLRGKLGFSKGDDEAVVFVNWREAVAFCEWLSKKEGKAYRLPTEAEWEYACRAGTTTPYHTGEKLPKAFGKNVTLSWFPGSDRGKDKPVDLIVGASPANAWGLRDMHGNVEEWCSDWYGPYAKGDQADPVGRADGDFKVTRGGSHSTTLEFLRSANRSGTLPEDKSWMIGFRVVRGAAPVTKPLPVAPPLHARNVKQASPPDLKKSPDASKPFFRGPRVYVKPPRPEDCPVFNRHNHCPAIVNCPNGDLLAIWYTCDTEPGRELGIVASRLPYGAGEWQPASPFWDAPDRNDHASALWVDEKGTIYHFNGLSAAATWGSLATIMRTSTDNGATWSKARLIMPEHTLHHMPIESVIRTKEGAILVPCDAVVGGGGGSAVLVSRDDGKTWVDPGEGRPAPDFSAGKTGAWIAGIHAGFVQLADGRLMAFGRGNTIDGRMPMSISKDLGRNWTYRASPFPPISGGQRLAILRLQEGPILFCSFGRNMTITDTSGKQRAVSGLFAALSTDEGKTWSIQRPITDDGPPRRMDGGGNTHAFTMSAQTAEPKGYMSICQTPDGVIHLISSRLHYEFNLAWIHTPAPEAKPIVGLPAPAPVPKAAELAAKASLASIFVPSDLPSKAGWRYNGSGVAEGKGVSFPRKGAMDLDTGDGQRVRWIGESKDGFGGVDAKTGFSAEIRMQVRKSTSKTRGIDFEACVGGGAKRRYFITVTTTGVYWNAGGSFKTLASGLDNHSGMHTYRLSVRVDGTAHIYRDDKLLGVRVPIRGADKLAGAEGSYLQWGDGAGGSETDATVEHVSYDLSGPFTPKGK